MQKIYWLIGGSALAMLLLIGFQLYWIKNSKQLIEDQFTSRVNMALCAAVEKISVNTACCQAVKSSCGTSSADCNEQVQRLVRDSTFTKELNATLNFYQINLPYEANITNHASSEDTTAPPYSCSLTPLVAQDDHWLQLIFQGKKDYFNQKMGFTLFSSVLIVCMILSLFVYAARSLIRQQKISEDNRHFFNHMTHEFSTPLTNIQLASNMIKRNVSPEKKEAYLDLINQQCLSLKQQVDTVLQIASVDQQNFVLHKETLNLWTLATEVVDEMKLQILEKNAVVHIHAAEEDSTIQGDKNHLRNVFRNLIDNALKYAPGVPRVDIDFYPGAGGWYAQVRDNGTGIPVNESEKIFHRYFRGSCSSDGPASHDQSSIHGFGLGLAYVKKILNLHQGDIRLLPSRSQGAHFELFFPK